MRKSIPATYPPDGGLYVRLCSITHLPSSVPDTSAPGIALRKHRHRAGFDRPLAGRCRLGRGDLDHRSASASNLRDTVSSLSLKTLVGLLRGALPVEIPVGIIG